MVKERMKFGLIIFFLAFTLADIGVPGFCQTDDHAADSFGPAEPATPDGFGLHSAPCGNSQPDDPRSREDDCFCCCSHIMTYEITLNTSLCETGNAPTLTSEPTSVPTFFSIYHPPRTA